MSDKPEMLFRPTYVYDCPIHGRMDAAGLAITNQDDGSQRYYCGMCLGDMLDREIGQLEQIKNEEKPDGR